jgi:hypothetical protein
MNHVLIILPITENYGDGKTYICTLENNENEYLLKNLLFTLIFIVEKLLINASVTNYLECAKLKFFQPKAL